MGTKNNPGLFDCYNNVLPDEESFTVLARDPDFAAVVEFWAQRRLMRIHKKECPITDAVMIAEAQQTAQKGIQWREENYAIWRKPLTNG